MQSDSSSRLSIKLSEGWHGRHLFYRFNRSRLRTLGPSELGDGVEDFISALDPRATSAPSQLQTYLVSGHKADFGVIALDADPLTLDGLHHRLMSGFLGPAIEPVWSYVSVTELSEYIPTPQEYSERLDAEGIDHRNPLYESKMSQYIRQLKIISRQRLQPDLPAWPAVCFYPMNRSRQGEDNWYRVGFDERRRLMAEHGESGSVFADKVSQMITVGVGLDDWEWGVTLWARNPEYLKEIVYQMRYDEASARFAEFGPFYSGYYLPPEGILAHCRVLPAGVVEQFDPPTDNAS